MQLDGTYLATKGKNWIEESHAQGFKDGTWKQSNNAGRELGQYEMVEGTGTELSWHENGELCSHRELVSGVQHGRLASWYDNGQLEAEVDFQNGKRMGPWKRWLVDGTVTSEGEYKNNLEHGRFITYDKDGRVEEERDYQRGKRHGIANSYRGGVQIVAGRFKQGKRDGTWTHWDEDGICVKTVTWEKNKIVKKERIDTVETGSV